MAKDLLPFSHKNISEVGHWCRAVRSGFQSVLLDGLDFTTLPRKNYFYNDLVLSEETYTNTNDENNIAVTLRFSLHWKLRTQTINNSPRQIQVDRCIHIYSSLRFFNISETCFHPDFLFSFHHVSLFFLTLLPDLKSSFFPSNLRGIASVCVLPPPPSLIKNDNLFTQEKKENILGPSLRSSS